MARLSSTASTSPSTVSFMYVVACCICSHYTGSAPDIAGQGIVNPIATILSMSMMFKYSLCLPALAQKIDEATKITIDKGVRTGDIGGTSKTAEVGDAIAAELETLLKK
jgi:3-isopropylmalate dehydrogenase